MPKGIYVVIGAGSLGIGYAVALYIAERRDVVIVHSIAEKEIFPPAPQLEIPLYALRAEDISLVDYEALVSPTQPDHTIIIAQSGIQATPQITHTGKEYVPP